MLSERSIAALEQIRKKTGFNAQPEKKIIFVSGNFNIVHPGHLRLFKFAAELGDYLVVAVYADKTTQNILNEELRLESIKMISLVDEAFILDDPIEDFLGELRPNFVVKGKEHELNENVEKNVVESFGGKLVFSSGDVQFSSLELISREIDLQRAVVDFHLPKNYLARHNLTVERLAQITQGFKALRICVVGDLILDEYISCDPLGMSQEDPTLVVTPIDSKMYIGGAAIVAAHAASLGAKVDFFTCVGDDTRAAFAGEELKKYNVNYEFFVDETRPTTLKQRFRVNDKTLLRVSHLRQHDIEPAIIRKVVERIMTNIASYDLVFFSDFNYGFLAQNMVRELIAVCKKNNVKMVADSQSSSQVGDIARYKELELITPTEREARLAMRDFKSGLVVLAEKLRKVTKSKNVITTLGASGVLVHAEIKSSKEWMTDKIPALNSAPVDVAGAGDSLLTCSSMALACGASIWESALLGSLASAIQVSRTGNIPLTTTELLVKLGQGHSYR
jgi:rfaE bifunctional protein kinase chain/domain